MLYDPSVSAGSARRSTSPWQGEAREIAGEIGISQAQVSRLEKHALGLMRKYV